MRRLLRLLLVCLLACGLPLQAAVASAMQVQLAPAHASTMAGDTPCPHHAHAHAGQVDKAGCGACCGPVAAAQAALEVAPVAARVAAVARRAQATPSPQFLTEGPERPPRLPA